MFLKTGGECEELNNSPHIPTAVTTDGRLLTRYAASSRSNGAVKSGWRRNSEREFGVQGWVPTQKRDQGVEKESLETMVWRMREWRLCVQSESAVCTKT